MFVPLSVVLPLEEATRDKAAAVGGGVGEADQSQIYHLRRTIRRKSLLPPLGSPRLGVAALAKATCSTATATGLSGVRHACRLPPHRRGAKGVRRHRGLSSAHRRKQTRTEEKVRYIALHQVPESFLWIWYLVLNLYSFFVFSRMIQFAGQ